MGQRSSGEGERGLAAKASWDHKTAPAGSKGSHQGKPSAQERWELCSPSEARQEEPAQHLARSSNKHQSEPHSNHIIADTVGSRWELACEPQLQEYKEAKAAGSVSAALDQPTSNGKQQHNKDKHKHKGKHKSKSKSKSKHKSKHTSKSKVKSKEKGERKSKSKNKPVAQAVTPRKRGRSRSRSPVHRYIRVYIRCECCCSART